MKSEKIIDAIIDIDDDLIEGADKIKTNKNKSPFISKRMIMIAAAVTILVCSLALIIPLSLRNTNPVDTPSNPNLTNSQSVEGSTTKPDMDVSGESVSPDESEPEGSASLFSSAVVRDNLWKDGNLRVYTLMTSGGTPLQKTRTGGNGKLRLLDAAVSDLPGGEASTVPENGIDASESSDVQVDWISVTESFSLDGLGDVLIDSVFDSRYVLVYELNLPYFIDLRTGEKINLSARILKDRYVDGAAIADRALELLSKEHPELLSTETNRMYVRCSAYVLAHLDPTGNLYWKMEEMRPELDLTGLPEKVESIWWEYKKLERYEEFNVMIQPYIEAAIEEEVPDREAKSLLIVRAVDGASGRCLYTKTTDYNGNDFGSLWLYDFASDTEQLLGHGCGVFPEDSAFTFGSSGKKIAVTTTSWNGERIQFCKDDETIDLTYGGDYLRVFDVDSEDPDHPWMILGAGRGILSPTESVVGIRTFPYNSEAEIRCTYSEYVRRFAYDDPGDGGWQFDYTDENGRTFGIWLPGAFERFAADDRAVIMRQNGTYHVYALTDLSYLEKGEDVYATYTAKNVTDDIREGRCFLYAHEYYRTEYANGTLFRVNYFTGEKTAVAENADTCVVSEDGSFAFVYSDRDGCARCINIATLESCAVTPGKEFLDALRKSDGAKMSILYNEEENTLTLCFVKTNANAEKKTSNFYDNVYAHLVPIKS